MSTESRHNLPVEAIQQALGSETVLTPPPHERGIRFTTPNVTVDVWPERQAVRITAEDSQHYFRNLEHTGISQDGMVLFGSTNPDRPKTVGVNYHGEVSIFERPREPTFAEFIAAGIEPPSEQVPSPAPEPAALPVRERGEKDPEWKRVGRVASVPKLTEQNGKARLNFLFAEPLPDGETAFHKVYCTGDRAKRFAQFPKGYLVEVKGYLQERQNKDGKPDPRVYAVVVRGR